MKSKVKYPWLRTFIQRYLLKLIILFVIVELGVIAYFQTKNNKPEALDDESSVYSGHSVDIPILQNDSDKDREDKIRVVNITQPKNGKVVLNKRVISYTPNPEFDGKDSFTYQLTDEKDESEPATVTVKVEENQSPQTVADEIIVFPWTGRKWIKVLENDKDREGDKMTVVSYSQTSAGQVELIDGKLFYTLTDTAIEQDSFTYTVSDGKQVSSPTPVTVKIKNPENTRFAKNEVFGDFRNHRQRSETRWDIVEEEDGNLAYGIVTGGYKSPGGNRLGEYSIVKDQVFKGDIQVKFRYKSLEDLSKSRWANLCLVFDYVNEMNYNYVMLNAIDNKNGGTGIYKIINGKRKEVVHGKSALKDNEWHELEVVRKGNEMTIIIDNEELLKASDDGIAGEGLIGFGSYHNRALFDDPEVIRLF